MVEKCIPVLTVQNDADKKTDAIQQLAFISYVSSMEPDNPSVIYKTNEAGIHSFLNYFRTQKAILKKLMDSQLVQ